MLYRTLMAGGREEYGPDLSQVFRSRSEASGRVTCDVNDWGGQFDFPGGLKPPAKCSGMVVTAVSWVTSGPAVTE